MQLENPKQSNTAALIVLVVAIGIVLAWVGIGLLRGFAGYVDSSVDRLANFTTIFLGIFLEALPFLLLGTLSSGLVEVFISRERMLQMMPRNPFLGAVMGGLMGLAFPVCECGVVPFTRRLFRKGLPLSVGISFLLAAPVLNPIVIFSTAAAFGLGPVLFLRVGAAFAIAVITGLVFAVVEKPSAVMRPMSLPNTPVVGFGGGGDDDEPSGAPVQPVPFVPLLQPLTLTQKLQGALQIAVDELFEMGRFLILGSALAALMQTFIPESALLGLNSNALLSVVALMLLAVVLSICSTVDAFVALAFTNTFATGSIMAFLIFGPMVDIKSTLMYLRVFNRRSVVYIILLPLLMSLLVGVFINLNVPF